MAVQMLSDHLIDRVVLQSINYSLHHHPDNPHVVLAPASSRGLKSVELPKCQPKNQGTGLEQITIEQP